MIRCFKTLAQKHSLSIITSIHQPNLEILVIFDMLYVLAKGGVCVYFDSPENLRTHLNEFHINCRENQIPIEVLVKMAANGCSDQSVIELSENTSKEMLSFEDRLKIESNLCENGIPIRSKSFSLQQMYYLLIRIIVYTVRYNWIQICIQFIVFVIFGAFNIFIFDYDLDGPSGCVPKFANSCHIDSHTIHNEKLIEYNIGFIAFNLAGIYLLVITWSSLSFSADIKVFIKEYQNC